MKWIGLLATITLVIACFFPWVFIDSKSITVTGVESAGTSFGRPGYFHFFLSAFYIVLNFIPRIWAKRFNILIATLNIAWTVRNYLLIPACSGGECPEKKSALYIVLISSIVMLVAALTPNVKLERQK